MRSRYSSNRHRLNQKGARGRGQSDPEQRVTPRAATPIQCRPNVVDLVAVRRQPLVGGLELRAESQWRSLPKCNTTGHGGRGSGRPPRCRRAFPAHRRARSPGAGTEPALRRLAPRAATLEPRSVKASSTSRESPSASAATTQAEATSNAPANTASRRSTACSKGDSNS